MPRVRYAQWIRPKLREHVVDFGVARGRLGGQTMHSHLSESEEVEQARQRHRAWMEKTTGEDRSRWARAAANARWRK